MEIKKISRLNEEIKVRVSFIRIQLLKTMKCQDLTDRIERMTQSITPLFKALMVNSFILKIMIFKAIRIINRTLKLVKMIQQVYYGQVKIIKQP